jgi:hypothetical protein
MTLETGIIMIVGIIALVSLRLILAHIGKQFRADHTKATKHNTPATVYRQTGKESHLMQLPEPAPLPAPNSGSSPS